MRLRRRPGEPHAQALHRYASRRTPGENWVRNQGGWVHQDLLWETDVGECKDTWEHKSEIWDMRIEDIGLLNHNVSFWAQKLHHLVSFWAQNNCCTIFTISGPRNCSFRTISGPRNCTIWSVSGPRIFVAPFLPFLGPKVKILTWPVPEFKTNIYLMEHVLHINLVISSCLLKTSFYKSCNVLNK